MVVAAVAAAAAAASRGRRLRRSGRRGKEKAPLTNGGAFFAPRTKDGRKGLRWLPAPSLMPTLRYSRVNWPCAWGLGGLTVVGLGRRRSRGQRRSLETRGGA